MNKMEVSVCNLQLIAFCYESMYGTIIIIISVSFHFISVILFQSAGFSPTFIKINFLNFLSVHLFRLISGTNIYLSIFILHQLYSASNTPNGL